MTRDELIHRDAYVNTWARIVRHLDKHIPDIISCGVDLFVFDKVRARSVGRTYNRVLNLVPWAQIQ